MASAKCFALAVVVTSLIHVNVCLSTPNQESMLVIGSRGQDAHALQAFPLQSVGRRLMQQQMAGQPEPIMKWLVDKHNELRARHGVPPMTWDWGLAWNAYNYVVNCPNGHSAQAGIGENMAWGHNDFNHAMRDWYDEVQFFNFQSPSFAENTGHFSAMVWKDSVNIGCAANLRCRFKTWICQFTPPGNYVLAGGGVDFGLWTSQVLPPSAQFVTGSKPDGSPTYASYDPTGESTRGLPSPQYGELKNFGYVPKPGTSVIMYDWQNFVPTSVLTKDIPATVLAQYLDKDTLALLAPDTKGGVTEQRTLVGWQRSIPASIIQQYVPADVLAQYVPDGVIMATTGATDSPLSKSAQHGTSDSSGDKQSSSSSSSSDAVPAAADAPAAADVPSAPAAAAAAPPPAAASGASTAAPVPDALLAAAPAVAAAPPPLSDAASSASTAAPVPDALVATAAAVLKPIGLPGSLNYMSGSRSNEQQQPLPTAAYIVPAQQPDSVMQMQPQQQMVLVQPAGGSPAYYMPVTAVQPASAPYGQQQQQQQQQPQQVSVVPGGIAMLPGIAPGVTGTSSNIQPAPTAAGAGAYPGYGPAVGRAGPSVVRAAQGPPRAMQEALNRQNTYRRRHQAAPLAWDAHMAAQAAAFASTCPMGRSDKAGLGESLAFGYPDAAAAVDAWYAQISAYNFAAPSFYPAAAQFSQLVWAGSKKVGCAAAAGCSMPTFVCYYHPAGNVIGRDWPFNVRAAAAAVPLPAVGGKPPGAGMAAAAVYKPAKPVADVARAFYARLGQPVTNDGTPISLASPPQEHATAAVLSPELQTAVDRHNTLRAKHGAPALQWDASIAATAQSWAAGCPNGHSGQSGVGENMAWGYASLADAVQAWYDEVKLYDFASPGWSPSTGHFTQLVWLSTSRLGCAINTACSWPTYVCQYGPPGNVLGTDWSKQVQREGSALPATANTPVTTSGSPTTAAPAPLRLPPPPTAAPRSPSPSPKPAVTLATPRASPSPSPKPAVAKASPSPSPTTAVARAAPSPSPTPVTPKPSASPVAVAAGPKDAELLAAFSLINSFRRTHQAPALAWDVALQASAQAWAATCQFAVSGTPGVGEGLGFGYSSFSLAVKDWYAQVSVYDFSSPGWSSSSGLFTQMVWRNSRSVGCAVNMACPWAMYVCHYSPPGNMVGPGIDWSQQVLPSTVAAVLKPQAAAVLKPGSGQASLLADLSLMGSRGSSFMQPHAPAEPALADAMAKTNALRARHQVSALSWDEQLAAQAAAYLADCPATHSNARGVGENMAWGFRSFGDVVDAWAGEASSYNFSSPGFSLMAGHFSQLVWRSTTKMGCALNAACTAATYSCRYSPTGNDVAADWTQQVMPDISADVAAGVPYSTWAPAGPTPAGATGGSGGSSSSSGAATGAGDSNTYVPFAVPDGVTSASLIVPDTWSNQQQQQQHDTTPAEQPVPVQQQQQQVDVDAPAADPLRPGTPVPTMPVAQFAAAPAVMPAPTMPATQFAAAPAVMPAPTMPAFQFAAAPAVMPAPTMPGVQFGAAPAVMPAPTMPATQFAAAPAVMPAPTMPAFQFSAGPAVAQAPTMPATQFAAAPTVMPAPTTAAAPTTATMPTPTSALMVPEPPSQQPSGSPAASTAARAMPTATDQSVPAEYASVLIASNGYRAKHQAPALAWDADLAASAQAFASGCPGGHSGDQGVGENMAWGYQSWQAAVDGWYNEADSYNFASPGFSGATGHFTQLVWRDTTKVGCGLSSSCGMATYVCQYAPAGNVMGIDWSNEVMPAQQ